MTTEQTAEATVRETMQRFRTVYTCDEFRTEILRDKLSVEWVQDECRAKRIKTVAARPYLIPQSEAIRFVFPAR